MFKKWKQSFIFSRESNIYTFCKNPLESCEQVLHIFMPWSNELDDELMFKAKEDILTGGEAYLPLINYDCSVSDISVDEKVKLESQLQSQVETHIIMTDFESIHVCRVKAIIENSKFDFSKNKIIQSLDGIAKNSKFIIVVDDLYVLDVNHIGSSKGVLSEVEKIITETQTHNVFEAYKSFEVGPNDELVFKTSQKRWVDLNRSLTYDYYIRSCELKDNIYQDSWKYLSRRTHHELISSSLDRHKGVLFRDIKKWKLLYTAFASYKAALIFELNNVYIRPLANAIVEYKILTDAWSDIQGGVINPKINMLITKLIHGEITEIEDLDDFLFYIKNIKSFLFTLKNKFTKKIYKEEFLVIENFLNREESLIESLTFRAIDKKILAIIEIDQWINETNSCISQNSKARIKDCNLKLSHLLSIMASASYTDNIFFNLIEEKAGRGTVQKSFEDEVKNLLSIEVKKSA